MFRSALASAYPPEMNRRLANVFVSRSTFPVVAWASIFPNAHPVGVADVAVVNSSSGGGGRDDGVAGHSNDQPSHKQTLHGPEAPLWRKAREEEIDNLFRHGVVEEIPEDSLSTWDCVKRRAWEVIDTIWAYVRKRDADGKICRYKGRCALRGDQQAAKANASGLDLNSFAPTTRHSTFRLVNAAGVIRKSRKRSFDFEAAFLQGDRVHNRNASDGDKAQEDVYARPPPGGGWVRSDERGIPMVWRLHRPLYGSADAAWVWYKTLDVQLVS